MRPFLLLSSRAEDDAADGEHAAFLRCTGLAPEQLRQIRMEAAPLPELQLDDFSGVFLGGGPFNSSDPAPSKSAVQRRVERELSRLLDEIVERDLPFFGACYGVGTLGVHQGAIVDRTHAEPVSAVPITLTRAGAEDPLLAGVPERFDAFVGHKEACRTLPPSAVLLASSPACPVQMFRVRPQRLRDAVPPRARRGRHRDRGCASTSTPATSRPPSWTSSSARSAPRW